MKHAGLVSSGALPATLRRLGLDGVALPNLTRDQAVERAALVTVDNYRISLDLTDGGGKPGERTFRSVTTVEFDALAGADTYIDIAADTIRSATLNGREIDVSAYNESTGIPLTGLAERNVVVVDADCRYSNTGEGLHRFVDPVDGEVYLYSQFETADAKRMFACFDQPDLKATFDIAVTAPVALGGGVQRRDSEASRTTATRKMHTFTVTPADEHLSGGVDRRARTRAGTTPTPTSTATSRSGLFCRKSLAEFMDAERLFTQTKQGFGFYHSNFGVPYAFGKYDQLFVPEFNAGAMENAGAVTFLEDYVFRSKVTRASYERRAETVLHEMAHMWFGDLVTMQWWDDLWLNESFATFASVLCQAEATEFSRGVDDIRQCGEVVGVSAGSAAVDAPGGRRHPRPGRGRGQLRRDHLRQGRQRAQAAGRLRRAGGVPGRPARLFPRPRIRQRNVRGSARRAGEGVGPRPVGLGAAVAEDHRTEHAARRLRPRRRRAVHPIRDQPERRGARCRRNPRAPAGHRYLRRRRNGKLVRVHREELDIEGDITEVPALQGVSRGKLILVNDDDLTYCSLRLDPDSLETVLTRIADIAEPLPRTLAWSAAWEMTREAEMKARDFVSLVAGGCACRDRGGGRAAAAAAGPDRVELLRRPGLGVLRRLAGLRRPAAGAGPRRRSGIGSPAGLRQRAVRLGAVAAPRRGAGGAAGHRSGRAGAVRPGGRRRPALAHRHRAGRQRRYRRRRAGASVHRRGGRSAIRPPPASGTPRKPRPRGRRPRSRTRRGSRSIEDDTLANITGRSIIAGFVQPGQAELLQPFSQRYFDAISGVWERRSSEVAQTVVIGLYPSWDISQAGLDAADAFLADPEVPPALRRLVLEGRAGVERALRARAFDVS